MRLAVAGQLSPRWDKPSGSGRYAAIRSLFGALTPNILLPSRRDNPITARGGDKASLASLGATLGCEAHPTQFSFHQSESQRWTALIPGLLFVHFQSVAASIRAATLWLPLVYSGYPGRRQRSLAHVASALGWYVLAPSGREATSQDYGGCSPC